MENNKTITDDIKNIKKLLKEIFSPIVMKLYKLSLKYHKTYLLLKIICILFILFTWGMTIFSNYIK